MWFDPSVVRFLGGVPLSREDVWARLLRQAGLWTILGYGYWTVRETDTGCFVGQVGFANYKRDLLPPLGDVPECGWVLAAAAQGRGYASEALAAALAWADAALDADRTVCFIEEGHAASIRLARCLGYAPYARSEYKGSPVALFERAARPPNDAAPA